MDIERTMDRNSSAAKDLGPFRPGEHSCAVRGMGTSQSSDTVNDAEGFDSLTGRTIASML